MAASARERPVARAAARPAGRARKPVARGGDAARSAPRRTQAERREEAERRLLEAALEIVARRGTVRMTLAEVGEAAGYSRGLAAHRFGSKAGLLRAVAGEIHRRFQAQLEAAPPRAPGLDAIRGNISVYFGRTDRAWTTTRALLVMMTEGMMEGAGLKKDMADYNRAALRYFAHHIRAGVAAGEMRADADPRADAVLLLGTLRGVMMQWLLDDGIRLARLRDRLLAIVDGALAA
jgi:AcrR family transcriptional regulator